MPGRLHEGDAELMPCWRRTTSDHCLVARAAPDEPGGDRSFAVAASVAPADAAALLMVPAGSHEMATRFRGSARSLEYPDLRSRLLDGAPFAARAHLRPPLKQPSIIHVRIALIAASPRCSRDRRSRRSPDIGRRAFMIRRRRAKRRSISRTGIPELAIAPEGRGVAIVRLAEHPSPIARGTDLAVAGQSVQLWSTSNDEYVHGEYSRERTPQPRRKRRDVRERQHGRGSRLGEGFARVLWRAGRSRLAMTASSPDGRRRSSSPRPVAQR